MITIKRARTSALALAIIAGTSLVDGVAHASPASPAIPLSTGQETTDATGGAHGFFSYEIEGDELCYTLQVQGLSAGAIAAHIHFAPRHVAGGIVVPLAVPNETSFEVSGCSTASATVLEGIAANPGEYYVNVHTPTYPGGEVRGQLK